MNDNLSFDNMVQNPNEYQPQYHSQNQAQYPGQNQSVSYQQYPGQNQSVSYQQYPGQNQYQQYPGQNQVQYPAQNMPQGATKFCKHCGQRIAEQAVVCPLCGCQVEQIGNTAANQPIIINNNNNNNNVSSSAAVAGGVVRGKPKSKWVAFFLCLLFGYAGIHKFYEGKILGGIIFLCTGGIFGVGWFIDTIALLLKPDPYYV